MVRSSAWRRTGVYSAAITMASALVATLGGQTPASSQGAAYLSPLCVALSPDGSMLYVTEHTGDRLAAVDIHLGKVAKEIRVPGAPSGVAVAPDGKRVFVACAEQNTVVAVDPASSRTGAKAAVGAYPWGLTLSSDGKALYVCNRFTHDVSVVDTAQMKETARIPVVREPKFATLCESNSTLIVGNSLALGSNHEPGLAADITFVDLNTRETTQLRLPTGCNEVEQLVCSPDGEWVYVVSLLSRFLVPTTQIQRGWINTNALSVINVKSKQLLATVLLDDLDLGAANPYGVTMTKDGTKLFVAISGSHEVMIVDVPKLHEIIEATPADERPELANDLTFLYRNDAKKRIKAEGFGPRGLTLTTDERGLMVANYFSDTVSLIDARSGKLVRTIALGPEPKMDGVRRGEFLFADATMCFQHWHSCLSCHPDGRADGLMWDLMNDGLGNPKNAKSLLLSGATPPVMAHGVRDTMRTAIDAGFKYILFRMPEEADVDAVEVYLNSMKPSRSPVLDNKELKKRAERGRKLFMDEKRTGCITCHPPELYTDLQLHDVGTRSQFDREGEFDTPTLIELFRSAPYLHDGTAVTLKDVLTTRNTDDMHGRTSGLSPEEIEDLALFLQSL